MATRLPGSSPPFRTCAGQRPPDTAGVGRSPRYGGARRMPGGGGGAAQKDSGVDGADQRQQPQRRAAAARRATSPAATARSSSKAAPTQGRRSCPAGLPFSAGMAARSAGVGGAWVDAGAGDGVGWAASAGGCTGGAGATGTAAVGAGATGAAEAAGPAAPVMPAEARAALRPPLPDGVAVPGVTGAVPPTEFLMVTTPGGVTAAPTSGPSTAMSPAVGTASCPSP